MSELVCAVIVTYHPSRMMLQNLDLVLKQVNALVVVDNASTVEELSFLREASLSKGFTLLENARNVGIAEALNRGVKWARDAGYHWVALFDQDSRPAENFIACLFKARNMHPHPELLASINPRYVNPDTGIEPKVLRAPDGGPVYTLTSGSLMPVWIFERIGMFPADFFIDQVDIEFCFRIRAAGYFIADSRDAVLWHKPGQPQRVSIFGFSFEPTNHGSSRRYYMSRNRVVVSKRYFRQFPRWTLRLAYSSFRETIKCFVAEKGRMKNLRSFLLGSWDGLVGRMGSREGM